MSARFNQTNNSGLVTNSGGNVAADLYVDQYGQPLGGAITPGGVSFYPAITVTSNGHAVERGSDFGLYDTVSNVPVRTDQCTFSTLQSNYPNV